MNQKIKGSLLCLTLCTSIAYSPTYAASATQQTSAKTQISNYAQTKYPMVFAHGLFGFGSVIGVDYFYQILPDLARNGGNVWSASVSPMNSSEIRGEQLLQQVDEIIALTGQPKVNLIGHSHGGQSIRYVAGVSPNKVASLTTIASPNQGAKIADLVLNIENTPLEYPVRAVFDSLVSPVITFAQGLNPTEFPHDSKAALKSLSIAGSAAFNQRFPAGVPTSYCAEGAYSTAGIYNYSFMGNNALNTVLDPSDYIAAAASLLINNGGDNDGVVARCDARFGKVIRDTYKWNHFDEINHVLGLKSIFAPSAVDIYRQHANRLKLQGL